MNLSSLQTLFPLLLPVPIALLAGVLRQDKFPDVVNEIISQSMIFLVALLSFLAGIGGHLTGNVQVDFLALVAYCGWLSNTAPFKPLHVYLQTNLLSLGVAKASEIEHVALGDIKAAVDRLNAFFEGASQNPQPAQVQQLAFPSNATFGVIPQDAMPSVSANTFPLAAIGRSLPELPQPPKG